MLYSCTHMATVCDKGLTGSEREGEVKYVTVLAAVGVCLEGVLLLLVGT